MSIAKLIDFFSTFQFLPVEISTVSEQIVESYQIADKIIFIPVDVDPAHLKGLHYRYFERSPDGTITRTVKVVFSDRLSIDHQRVVCCKELIHIMDAHFQQTNDPAALNALVEILTDKQKRKGTASSIADIAATKDQLALYQAIAVLTPEEIREDLVLRFSRGEIDIHWIAQILAIPPEYVSIIVAPEWTQIWKFLQKV